MKEQWRIKKIVYITVVTALVSLLLYGAYYIADQYFLVGVRVGMTRDEVMRILGSPTGFWVQNQMRADDWRHFDSAMWRTEIIPNNVVNTVIIKIDNDKVSGIYVRIFAFGHRIEKDYE